MENQFPSERQMAACYVWLIFNHFQVESDLAKHLSRLGDGRRA
jgi:hypothetical protein